MQKLKAPNMTANLFFHHAGPGVTIQDQGRRHFMRFGVTPAGAMDLGALTLAHDLLGNAHSEAAIEISLAGACLSSQGQAITVAIAGGAFCVRKNNQNCGSLCRLHINPGEKLEISAGKSGAWCVLAIAGGIDLPPVLGSRATHTRSALGPLSGKCISTGDQIPLKNPNAGKELSEIIHAELPPMSPQSLPVIPGPQKELFSTKAWEEFLSTQYQIALESDRMAYRLKGPKLQVQKGYDIVSDGATRGAIQISGDGQPFILMADHQTTGGYPKISCIASGAFDRLAQMRAGDSVSFVEVNQKQALKIRNAQKQRYAQIYAGLQNNPVNTQKLLSVNLITGAITGDEKP